MINTTSARRFFIGFMKNTLITITTDLGDQFAASQLHAVLVKAGYAGRIIENHSVRPFSILEGAFELMAITMFVPSQTIHVAVVDPGVGSKRKGIILKTKRSWFVGPDNGLLYPAATQEGILFAWQLNEAKVSNTVSNTFHGRDVFIKVATYLANGQSPKNFGSTMLSIDALKSLTFKKRQVLHVDHYGNSKIYWPGPIDIKKAYLIKTKAGTFTVPFVRTFSDVPIAKPLALLGSTGTLELAVNQRRGDRFFGLSVGTIVCIR